MAQSYNLDFSNLYHWFIQNYSILSVPIAMWEVHQHAALLHYGHPEFGSWLMDLSRSRPVSLTHCLLSTLICPIIIKWKMAKIKKKINSILTVSPPSLDPSPSLCPGPQSLTNTVQLGQHKCNMVTLVLGVHSGCRWCKCGQWYRTVFQGLGCIQWRKILKG